MVEKNSLKTHYIEQFTIVNEFGKKISDYTNFQEAYAKLVSSREVDENKWESFLEKFFSRVVEDASYGIINMVETSKNIILQDFSSELEKLKKINKTAGTELKEFEGLYILREEVENIYSKIKSKMQLAKHLKNEGRKNKWVERLFAFVIGVIISYLAYLFFT